MQKHPIHSQSAFSSCLVWGLLLLALSPGCGKSKTFDGKDAGSDSDSDGDVTPGTFPYDLCWTDARGVLCMEFGHEPVVLQPAFDPVDIVILSEKDQLYWTDSIDGSIWRASLNGSEPYRLLKNISDPRSLAISGEHIYWVAYDSIQRAKLSGGPVENIVTDLVPMSGFHPSSIHIAIAGDMLFWSEPAQGRVMRSSLDGSNPQTVGTSNRPSALAVTDTKLYWVDNFEHRILRANLDGTEQMQFAGTGDTRFIPDLIVANNKLYRSAVDATTFQTGSIASCTLESPPACDTDIWDIGTPSGLSVLGDTLYWIDEATSKIRHLKIGSTEVTDLITGTNAAQGIVAVKNKLYWINVGIHTVSSFDLDSGQTEHLVSDEFSHPVGLAVSESKLYWIDFHDGQGKIQSMDLDGSNLSTVKDDLSYPDSVNPQTIAATQSHLYWTVNGSSTDSIFRLDLDGGETSAIVTDIESAYGVNVSDGKLYWTNTSAAKVQAAELDGTNVRDILVVGPYSPRGIAISDKVYWAEDGSIHRANFDGTHIETVVRNIAPRFMVLLP